MYVHSLAEKLLFRSQRMLSKRIRIRFVGSDVGEQIIDINFIVWRQKLVNNRWKHLKMIDKHTFSFKM